MINLRFKQDILFWLMLWQWYACVNMNIIQNTTKMTFSKDSKEDLFTELELKKLSKYYATKWCY